MRPEDFPCPRGSCVHYSLRHGRHVRCHTSQTGDPSGAPLTVPDMSSDVPVVPRFTPEKPLSGAQAVSLRPPVSRFMCGNIRGNARATEVWTARALPATSWGQPTTWCGWPG